MVELDGFLKFYKRFNLKYVVDFWKCLKDNNRLNKAIISWSHDTAFHRSIILTVIANCHTVTRPPQLHMELAASVNLVTRDLYYYCRQPVSLSSWPRSTTLTGGYAILYIYNSIRDDLQRRGERGSHWLILFQVFYQHSHLRTTQYNLQINGILEWLNQVPGLQHCQGSINIHRITF